MKSIFLFCTAMMLASRAAALHAPNADDLRRLQDKIRLIHAVQKGDGIDPHSGIRGALNDLDAAKYNIDPDSHKVAALEQRIKDLRNQQATLCQEML